MIDLGLQRISRLMAATPMPWRAIHVAGTNGKGSVCAYISEMLNVYNRSRTRIPGGQPALKHGRFTSPHLVDPWDCITFSDDNFGMQPIEKHFFYNTLAKVAERDRKQNINATNFELLTATAFEAFTQAKLDVAVVEVGMGGRLDSTNIIGQPLLDDNGSERADVDRKTFRTPPLVTAITKIGLDHQGFLGDTIEEIAQQKAGILKDRTPVVYDASNEPSVCEVLKNTANEHQAPHVRAADGAQLGLSGPPHKLQNLAMAAECVSVALKELGRVPGSPDQHTNLHAEMLRSASSLTFPGRQETIDIGPISSQPQNRKLALLDGAHNAQSAGALATCLQATDLGNGPRTWILAASDSKDLQGILQPLLQNGDSVFAVEFGPVEQMPWVKPMPSADIIRIVQGLNLDLATVASYGGDIDAAIHAARETSSLDPETRDIVITGSLYLVGDVHRRLREAVLKP